MMIELIVRNGQLAVVTLQGPPGRPPRKATRIRVSDRGPAALGWNQLYATLVAHAQQNGQVGGAAVTWARQTMFALGQIDGVQPAAMTLADLRYLLANLAALVNPDLSNVVLGENLIIQPMLDDLDAREQDLGDAYSPLDDPDPSFAETVFTAATRAIREGRYEGWWSPIEREPLPVGALGGPGKLEALAASSAPASQEPLLGIQSELGIDGGHRLLYLGQDRILDWVPAAASSQYRTWMFRRFALPGEPVLDLLMEQEWRTIDAGHELIWLGRDPRADPHSTDDLVLDWAPATGNYRLYRVDLEGTKDDGATPDILPEPPLASGNWTTIRTGQKLTYLGGNRVLGWEPATGHFRIWTLDRGASGTAAPSNDPLPNVEVQGTWETIRDGHRLIYLGGDRVLTWLPATKWYRIWRYDRSVTGTADPLVSPALVEGHWQDIDETHDLVWLGGRHVLDWQPGSDAYRIRSFDRTVLSGDPLT